MKKRIFALCSALLLSLTVFAGCGSKPTEESAASEPEATATAAPTAEAESSAAESTAEPTEAPSTEPANVNLLTGLPTLTDGAIGKRPVAVMVNNVDAALPQYGMGIIPKFPRFVPFAAADTIIRFWRSGLMQFM